MSRQKSKGTSSPDRRPDERAALLAELADHANALAGLDPAAAGPTWGATQRVLLRLKADARRVMQIVMTRDIARLGALVSELRGETSTVDADGGSAPPATSVATDSTGALAQAPAADTELEIDPLERRRALRAFRKRLKLTRLDHESRLGVGPMSSGRRHEVDAILPPREFPDSVWRALVRSGDLRDAGRGFYELVDESAEP